MTTFRKELLATAARHIEKPFAIHGNTGDAAADRRFVGMELSAMVDPQGFLENLFVNTRQVASRDAFQKHVNRLNWKRMVDDLYGMLLAEQQLNARA